MAHYSDGRRWSDKHQAWVLTENYSVEDEVASLREALKETKGWIQHWMRDVDGDLKPTTGSLEEALTRVTSALNSPRTFAPAGGEQ